MRFTDEELVAYVDGELPADRAQAVAAACASETQIAGRVRQLAESRDALRNAFAKKLDEKLPDRLLAVLQEQKVVPMRARTSRARAWLPLALAASFALAIAVVVRLQQTTMGSAVALIDDALLQQALEHNVSGEPQRIAATEIMPTSTLVDPTGQYCREYEATSASQKVRGIACRGAKGWVTQIAKRDESASAPAADGYQPASGETDHLAASLGNITPLTPAQEQSAIDKGWGEHKQ